VEVKREGIELFPVFLIGVAVVSLIYPFAKFHRNVTKKEKLYINCTLFFNLKYIIET
jgi:hypothetical protein